MQVQSGKAKGRRLQQFVRDLLLETFKDTLETDDIQSTSMGAPGEDLKMSPAARKIFPFAIECKNQESLGIWSALEQAEANAKHHMPLLVFKRNRSKTYATLDINDLVKILKELHELRHTKNSI